MISTNLSRRRVTRRAAFTLLEVLVVVAIIVILAGVASISVFRYLDDAKYSKAKVDMQALEKAVQTFNLKNGSYPENLSQATPFLEQGLEALNSPWPGVQYSYTTKDFPQVDGTMTTRPIIIVQTPRGEMTHPDR